MTSGPSRLALAVLPKPGRSTLALAVLLSLGLAGTAAAFKPPTLESSVMDPGHFIPEEERAQLEARLDHVRERSGNAVVVFVAPSLDGEPVEDVAYETFNAWGVGQKGKDNGVLLLLAPNDRKVRIETGKGEEGDLTDIQSGRILHEIVTPQMKAGNVGEAAWRGSAAILQALGHEPGAPGAPPPVPRERRRPPEPAVHRALPADSDWLIHLQRLLGFALAAPLVVGRRRRRRWFWRGWRRGLQRGRWQLGRRRIQRQLLSRTYIPKNRCGKTLKSSPFRSVSGALNRRCRKTSELISGKRGVGTTWILALR